MIGRALSRAYRDYQGLTMGRRAAVRGAMLVVALAIGFGLRALDIQGDLMTKAYVCAAVAGPALAATWLIATKLLARSTPSRQP